MTLRVVTPPGESLAGLKLVKQQLELEGSHRDLLVQGQIATALSRLEGVVQRRYLTQTLDYILPCWAGCIRLPVAPVATGGVVSITYVDADGVSQTMDPSDYVVSPAGPTVSIRPASGSAWPALGPDAAEAVRIRFGAGESAEAVALNSPHVVTAALLMTAWLFGNRGDAETIKLGPTGLPESVEGMILVDHWT